MLVEKKNIKNSVKIKAVEKKKKIGLSSINKSMSSLIKKLEKADNNITPESSETDEESSNASSPKSHVIDIPVTIDEENEVIISDNDPNEMKEVDFSNNSL